MINTWKYLEGYIQTWFIRLPILYFCWFLAKRSDWRKSLFCRKPQDKPTVIDSANWDVQVVLSDKMRFLYWKYKPQNYWYCCWKLPRSDQWAQPGLPFSCCHYYFTTDGIEITKTECNSTRSLFSDFQFTQKLSNNARDELE